MMGYQLELQGNGMNRSSFFIRSNQNMVDNFQICYSFPSGNLCSNSICIHENCLLFIAIGFCYILESRKHSIF